MQAILLATGETQKLRPMTERIPSPMITVLNRPIMAYNLELLGRLGFKHIIISTHYLASQIEAYFRDGKKWGLQLEYVLQRDPLGSAGALRWARWLLKEPFIVMPGDEIVDFALAQAIEYHIQQQSLATVVVRAGIARAARALWVDECGQIRAHGSSVRGFSKWTDTGIYLFDPCVLDLIPARAEFDIHQDLLPKILNHRIPVWAYPLQGYWNPLDSLRLYADAQQIFLARAVETSHQPENQITYRYSSLDNRLLAPGIWSGRNTRIHPSVKISPPIMIGSNTWIGSEVELGPGTVIGSNVVIDQGANLQYSIIADDTYVGKLVFLKDRLVNQDQLVDLWTNDYIRVTEPLLLGKASTHIAAARLVRPLEASLAGILLLGLAPVLLTIGVVQLVSTGRALTAVPCRSTRPVHWRQPYDKTDIFHLLRFNTRRYDGRKSRFGEWLECWEGHRLPELLNVVKGDLSFVGLKPVLTEEELWIRSEFRMNKQDETPAGFTGLWYIQPVGENQLEEHLAADAFYIATNSRRQDLKILWKTPNAWFRNYRRNSHSKQTP